MKLLFKYASMGRPELFKQTLQKYYSMLSNQHPFEFIITLNEDDLTMNTEDVKQFLHSFSNLKFKYGKYSTKIEAINADMENADFDILIVISDDMIPIVLNFDDVIVRDMKQHFPNLDGALHYNDSIQNENFITQTIMGKKLYDYFGYIYNPIYKSFSCDCEFTDIVRIRNKVVYIPKMIIKHEHKGDDADNTYRKNSSFLKRDQMIYLNRKAQGFPK